MPQGSQDEALVEWQNFAHLTHRNVPFFKNTFTERFQVSGTIYVQKQVLKPQLQKVLKYWTKRLTFLKLVPRLLLNLRPTRLVPQQGAESQMEPGSFAQPQRPPMDGSTNKLSKTFKTVVQYSTMKLVFLIAADSSAWDNFGFCDKTNLNCSTKFKASIERRPG